MINGTYRFSFNPKRPMDFKKIRKIVLWSLLGIFVLVGVLTSWFQDIRYIAEDLGFMTPEVQQLLQDSGLPGMKVLVPS